MRPPAAGFKSPAGRALDRPSAPAWHKARKPVRECISVGFAAWIDSVHRCYLDAADRFEPGTDLRELAEFTLTTVEGGIMQARTFRDVSYFGRSVKQLRRYVQSLLRKSRTVTAARSRRPR